MGGMMMTRIETWCSEAIAGAEAEAEDVFSIEVEVEHVLGLHR